MPSAARVTTRSATATRTTAWRAPACGRSRRSIAPGSRASSTRRQRCRSAATAIGHIARAIRSSSRKRSPTATRGCSRSRTRLAPAMPAWRSTRAPAAAFSRSRSTGSPSAAWGIDPGFTKTNLRFFFALDATCVACHTDPPRRSLTSEETFFEPMPAGVGCERCHGPGAKHVATSKREDIINPTRLTPTQQIEVCAQCHQDTASVYLPGKQPFGYRPGDPLDGFRRNHVREPADPDRVDPARASRSNDAQRVLLAIGRQTDVHELPRSAHELARPDPRRTGRSVATAVTPPSTRAPRRSSRAQGTAMTASPVTCGAARPTTSPRSTSSTTGSSFARRRSRQRPQAPPERIVTWAEHLSGEGTRRSRGWMPRSRSRSIATAGPTRPSDARGMRSARAATCPRSTSSSRRQPRCAAPRSRTRRSCSPRRSRLRRTGGARCSQYAMAVLDAGSPRGARGGAALDRMIALDPADQRALEVKGMLLVAKAAGPKARRCSRRPRPQVPPAEPRTSASRRSHSPITIARPRRRELEAARRIAPDDPWIVESPRAREAARTAATRHPRRPRHGYHLT